MDKAAFTIRVADYAIALHEAAPQWRANGARPQAPDLLIGYDDAGGLLCTVRGLSDAPLDVRVDLARALGLIVVTGAQLDTLYPGDAPRAAD
jgi:hypothetical protein